MDNKKKIEKQIEQKLKENQLDKIDVSDFAKLYKNQITYDFANLYNSFEFNISKEDKEDFNICLNYYLEQENQYFVIKPENTYYYDADISDSLQKVDNAFLKNKLDYIKDIINESILENNYDNIEERNTDVYFKSLLEKYIEKYSKEELETKKINYNIESSLDNYKEQALELCSKDNPYFKLKMFIKDLVKELSNEEKLNLFKQVNETISQEINNLQKNCNHTENNETNTNTSKWR